VAPCNSRTDCDRLSGAWIHASPFSSRSSELPRRTAAAPNCPPDGVDGPVDRLLPLPKVTVEQIALDGRVRVSGADAEETRKVRPTGTGTHRPTLKIIPPRSVDRPGPAIPCFPDFWPVEWQTRVPERASPLGETIPRS
jgi:hypothetical protein